MKAPKYVVKCEDGTEIRTDRRGAWPNGAGRWLDTGKKASPLNRQQRRGAVSKLTKAVRKRVRSKAEEVT